MWSSHRIAKTASRPKPRKNTTQRRPSSGTWCRATCSNATLHNGVALRLPQISLFDKLRGGCTSRCHSQKSHTQGGGRVAGVGQSRLVFVRIGTIGTPSSWKHHSATRLEAKGCVGSLSCSVIDAVAAAVGTHLRALVPCFPPDAVFRAYVRSMRSQSPLK